MSWFSEIASKAEAMLVKLDQDAAQVLQNPDEARSGSSKFANATSSVDVHQDDAPIPTHSRDRTKEIDDSSTACVDINQIQQVNSAEMSTQSLDYRQGPSPEWQVNGSVSQTDNNIIQSQTGHDPTSIDTLSEVSNVISSREKKPNGSLKKFTLKGSGNSPFGVTPDRRAKSSHKNLDIRDQSIEERTASISKRPRDIRDSIKQSLREYTSQKPSRPGRTASSPYSTHFDDQPNLIRYSSETNGYPGEGNTPQDRLSPSLSINLPDDELISSSSLSDDIAARLLRETASKRKSSSYVHEIMNRLTNSNRQSMLVDQVKLNYKRAKLGGASCARRLNYYFRAYPMMKYAMLIYLIVMQLLVVYVLFFYQSSSGNSPPIDSSSNADKLDSIEEVR